MNVKIILKYVYNVQQSVNGGHFYTGIMQKLLELVYQTRICTYTYIHIHNIYIFFLLFFIKHRITEQTGHVGGMGDLHNLADFSGTMHRAHLHVF